MNRWFYLALVLLPACTLEDGKGFATLEEVELSATMPSASLVTELGYRVELVSAELTVDDVLFQTLTEGGAGGGFNPANPPPGYDFCHGGHCHSESGALVSYEDITRELAAGAPRFDALASAPFDRTFDLLSDAVARSSNIEPTAELPRSHLDRVTVGLVAIRLNGNVTGGDLGNQVVPLEVVLPLGSSAWREITVPIDRDHPPRLRFDVALVTLGMLDEVDFATLASAGSVTIADPESEAAEHVVEAILGSPLEVQVERLEDE